MNELTWIKFLKKSVPKRKNIITAIGDDCAVIDNKDNYLLLTSDLFIENVHFKLNKVNFTELGKRAAARALSDIVACAGVPKFLAVSVGFPPHINFRNLKSIFSGIKQYCRRYKVNIIGGDTSLSTSLFMDIWAMGITKKYILRSTAKIGDYIFVTGQLGRLKFNEVFDLRVKEIQRLTRTFKVNSMIDISDGFVLDLFRILRMSNKGALIYGDQLPLTKDINDIFRGEDYEIIFTVDKSEKITFLRKKYFLVGEIRESKFGYKIKFGERVRDVEIKGYTHF